MKRFMLITFFDIHNTKIYAIYDRLKKKGYRVETGYTEALKRVKELNVQAKA